MEELSPNLQGVRLLRFTSLFYGLDTRLEQPVDGIKKGLSRRKLCTVCLNVQSTVILIAVCVTLLGHYSGMTFLMRVDNIPPESTYLWGTLATHFFLTAHMYVRAYFRKNKLRLLFEEFEGNINRICVPELREKCDKAIKYVVIGYCCIACVITYVFFTTNYSANKLDISSITVLKFGRNSTAIVRVFKLSRYATGLVATPFVAFFEILFATMCFTIAHLYTRTVMQIKEEASQSQICESSLRQKLNNHKMLGNFVMHFDDFFSEYMIATIAVTIVDSIVQMKAYFSIGGDVTGICITALRFVTIFVKSFAASKVNQRIDLSLNTKVSSLPSMDDDQEQSFTQEHKHYLLYLTECSIAQAAVTYGGFSPIRNDVIVTIAGTLATYYLLLIDTFSSDQAVAQMNSTTN